MPDTKLTIEVGGSAFQADLENLQPWRTLLGFADSIGLARDEHEVLRVELGGLRRWIAFKRDSAGSPLYCIGYQETVGAIRNGDQIIGGSSRKTLAWLYPSGQVVLSGD